MAIAGEDACCIVAGRSLSGYPLGAAPDLAPTRSGPPCPRKLRVLNLTTQAAAMTATGKRAWRQRNEMSFTPTTAQLELFAELEMARMPVALTANRLGVDLATFKAWTARLVASRDFEEPPPISAEIMCKLCHR